MKLSFISLFTAMLAAIAASAIADNEPVALFKRQAPDRHRQAYIRRSHLFRMP